MRNFSRHIIAFLCAVVLCGALVITVYPTAAPSLSAECAVLMDASTGEVLFEHSADKRCPMASTTKIMTAVVALENSSIDDNVCIEAAAVGVEGSSVYLHEGENLSMENLLYALLLQSANDAAVAIAIAVAGGIDDFAALMNAKAEELKLDNTHFTNPHGLDNEQHYTSARDLATLTSYALQNETFAKIVSTYKKTIPLDNDDGARVLINHNKLLRLYDGAIGVKTGFTKRSGRCLVSAARRDDLTLIAVTLNASDDWNDHRKMLDYGFGTYKRLSVLSCGGFTATIPVIGGTEGDVVCVNLNEISATLPKDADITDCTCKTELPRFLYAPVEKGECVGRLKISYGGSEIGETELAAAYAIEVYKPKLNFWQKIAAFFAGLFGK